MSRAGRRRVGLLTGRAWPQGASDDAALVAALAGLGIETRWIPWDAAPLHADAVDALLVRSCWDYPERWPSFLAALDAAARRGVAVFNPPDLVRWNADKRYLRALAAAGVDVVPTLFCDDGDVEALAREVAAQGWHEVVLKPAVSVGARHTMRLAARALLAGAAALAREGGRSPWLVQPYLREIEDDGEWSLFYFGGAFSHAVRKRPARGDFRVQEQHGGTTRRELAPFPLRREAERALTALPHAPLYARVDGVEQGGRFLLMELEVIEPFLFLGHDPAAAPRLARALAALLPGPDAG